MTAIAADGLVPEIADFDYWSGERLSLAVPRVPVTVARAAWEYRSQRAYFLASYTKTALVLRTVEGLIGPEAMAKGMRGYVESFSFRHPTGSDLVETLSKATGWDLGPFFDQAVYSDAEPDWAVLSVRQRRPRPADGFSWDGSGWIEIEGDASSDDQAADDLWIVDLQLARRGDFIGPVEVELRWSDGTTERRTWDSESRWVRWRLEGESRLDQVVVDPDLVWMLETYRVDNYWRDRAVASDDPLWWVRKALEFAGQLFLRFS